MRSRPRSELDEVLPGATVARFTRQDLSELVVLQRCCLVQEAITNNTLEVPALHETHDQVLAWAATWTTRVVRLDSRLIAGARGRREGSGWQIGRLMVVPDLVGRGLGSWLLAHIEGLAPSDVNTFFLFAGGRSDRNISLYQRAGYRLAPPPEPHVPGHIKGAVYLVKDRPPVSSPS